MMKSSPWVEYYQSLEHPTIRLFCFPHAGGSAVMFRGWQEQIAENVEVWPIQLPGRGKRLYEPAFRRLDSLVRSVASALLPYLGIPFVFFGHSMGSLISFELARFMRREYNVEPIALLVSGCRAPHLPDPTPARHNLPDVLFSKELRRLNGTPEEILNSREAMSLMAPALRADFEVVETYLYEKDTPLSCPIGAYGGLQDEEALPDEMMAWQAHTSSYFRLTISPGDHFFITKYKTEMLVTLARDLNWILKERGVTNESISSRKLIF